MIKIFSLKQQKKAEDAAAASGTKKTTAAEIRVQKDLGELSLPKTVKMEFPNVDDVLNFKLAITPDEGFYKGATFNFTFSVKSNYPHEPPKVQCLQKIYHPNIDLEGKVCLNILREDWKPVLSINSVIYGLQYLFLEPNPDDPLNKEAAEVLRSNRKQFEQNVQKTLRGGNLNGVVFDTVVTGR